MLEILISKSEILNKSKLPNFQFTKLLDLLTFRTLLHLNFDIV